MACAHVYTNEIEGLICPRPCLWSKANHPGPAGHEWEEAIKPDTYPQALRNAIQRNIDMISESAAFVSLYSPAMANFKRDPLPAIQLAIAILLDKPIVIGCLPGREPPAKLRAIADHVFFGDPEFIASRVAEVLRS